MKPKAKSKPSKPRVLIRQTPYWAKPKKKPVTKRKKPMTAKKDPMQSPNEPNAPATPPAQTPPGPVSINEPPGAHPGEPPAPAPVTNTEPDHMRADPKKADVVKPEEVEEHDKRKGPAKHHR